MSYTRMLNVFVIQVLQRLLEHQLCVKAGICEFHASTGPFLGFIVSEMELQMDPEKVRVVAIPTPSSQKELQRFPGFANFYRKFICNFSTVTALMHVLTSSETKFSWNPCAENAFQHLRKASQLL